MYRSVNIAFWNLWCEEYFETVHSVSYLLGWENIGTFCNELEMIFRPGITVVSL
jgi:hypothetical protein